jgi:4-oxalocrotonate tautomerase
MPIVTIQMAAGRTLEQKRRVVEEFTATLVAVMKVDPADVTILVHELPRESIAKAGVLLSER